MCRREDGGERGRRGRAQRPRSRPRRYRSRPAATGSGAGDAAGKQAPAAGADRLRSAGAPVAARAPGGPTPRPRRAPAAGPTTTGPRVRRRRRSPHAERCSAHSPPRGRSLCPARPGARHRAAEAPRQLRVSRSISFRSARLCPPEQGPDVSNLDPERLRDLRIAHPTVAHHQHGRRPARQTRQARAEVRARLPVDHRIFGTSGVSG